MAVLLLVGHGQVIIHHRFKWSHLETLTTIRVYVISDSTNMMTSSNGNIFRVSGLLCGEFTGHWWIPSSKASDAELWYFLWSVFELTVEQRLETPAIWDAIALIMTSLWWYELRNMPVLRYRRVYFIKWQYLSIHRADSRLAPSQWEASLQINAASHWLGANLESTLVYVYFKR